MIGVLFAMRIRPYHRDSASSQIHLLGFSYIQSLGF